MSAFGDLAYPADFHHFRYVDPKAPKGGTFSQIGPDRQFNQNFLTFNSLNSYILKGDAAQGMELTFATLMVRSGDEPDAMYGLAAAKVRRSADGLTYRFFIRPEAKFHDGTRLTAHDVAFSLNILKEKGHPLITQSLRDFTGAKADDEVSVVATFAPNRARDVPLFVAGLPIFSRAYYATKPFDESTLDVPLGSGAYKVGRFEPGRFIEYERVKDWWGADLPVARGQNNFDIVRFEYYRDRDCRLRRLHRRELSVSRGVHLAHLGDALRFPRRQGRPRQKRCLARRHAVRRARLVHQHAARKIRRPAAARSALRRLRLRMDQQDHHVRVLRSHRVGVPEFGHDGEGQAGRRRAGAARTVPRPRAGRSVRRTLSAAGLRRLGPRPRPAAQSLAAPQGRRLRRPTASAFCRTASR